MSFDSGGGSDGNAGSEATVIQKQIYRRSRPYYYGRSTYTNLEFDITIGSGDPISAIDRAYVEKWLIGRMGYLPLQIVQSDMTIITFYVIFDKAVNKYIGNIGRGITLHAYCRDPWAWEPEIELINNYTAVVATDTINIMNNSDDSDYLKPRVIAYFNGTGGYLSIINETDAYREFRFDGLDAYEQLTVDNSKEIISSDTGLLRMPCFTSKKFLRLLPGMNTLTLEGNIYKLYIYYQFARKVGG